MLPTSRQDGRVVSVGSRRSSLAGRLADPGAQGEEVLQRPAMPHSLRLYQGPPYLLNACHGAMLGEGPLSGQHRKATSLQVLRGSLRIQSTRVKE